MSRSNNQTDKPFFEPVCEEKSERTGSFHARKSLVVGLTGGIATGKSTVAGMLKELGARVMSADEVVHELLRPHTPTWQNIVKDFGEQILKADESIDRKKLGEIVFSDPDARRRLESLTHPAVLEKMAEAAREFRCKESGVLVLEIPLLVETASTQLVDKVLVVTAEQDTQIKRLENRYGIDHDTALRRILAQFPMSEKTKVSDWVVCTEGTLDNTREQVRRVWSSIQKSLAQCK